MAKIIEDCQAEVPVVRNNDGYYICPQCPLEDAAGICTRSRLPLKNVRSVMKEKPVSRAAEADAPGIQAGIKVVCEARRGKNKL